MGKGGSKTRLPAGLDALGLIQAQGARKTIPLRNEVFRQVQAALEGKTENLPLTKEAQAASRQATELSVSRANEDLQARGIGGPFASRALAQTRLTGEQATAAIPSMIAQQLFAQGPALSQVGYPGAAVSGSATTTTPDTATPAIGAGASIAAAVIAAV